MILLKQAVQILTDRGVPVSYHTLYAWAKNGIFIGDRPMSFATQVGNRWMVDPAKLQEIIEGTKQHERIRIDRSSEKKSASRRGRKPGTKFGTYGKRDKAAANGMLPA